jgi:hypothetical protein
MTKQIQWETDLDDALVMARGQGKAVLLDFFNPA